MQDESMRKIGAICSIVLGISYLMVGIFHTLSPVEHRISSGPDVFLPAIASGFSFSTLVTWSFALACVVALAAIPAIAERFGIYNRGLVSWTRNLALLGYGSLAVNEFTLLARWPALASAYVEGDAAARAAISAQPLLLLDPHGWLSFGGVGTFIFVISFLALKHRAMPRLLGIAGLLGGVLFWFSLVGFILENELVLSFAAGFGGAVVIPIFYIWTGLILRREKDYKLKKTERQEIIHDTRTSTL
jgi:hypothetical protein